MTKKNMITISFPSIVMIFITLFTNFNLDKFIILDYKGIFVVSIVVLFPLLLLVQGVISALNRTNILLSLAVSLITTIIVGLVLCSNGTVIQYKIISYYSIRYLKYGIVGYLISYIIIQIRSKTCSHNTI